MSFEEVPLQVCFVLEFLCLFRVIVVTTFYLSSTSQMLLAGTYTQ